MTAEDSIGRNVGATREGLSGLVKVLAILFGILIGVGVFTFHYAEGFSYFSKDPAACKNCHIMKPQFDSWQKSSHHTVAACVDCHLPHDLVGKYVAKAENGFNHSKAFTLQNFHEPIAIKQKNSRILEKNCIECHRTLVERLVQCCVVYPGALSCVHCHRAVGHGASDGLGGSYNL
jgi:cytochrome c nitrite reductase small subunit